MSLILETIAEILGFAVGDRLERIPQKKFYKWAFAIVITVIAMALVYFLIIG